MRAAEVMSERVLQVRPETTVSEIAQLLAERQISAVPVVEADGRLVGIVTEGDLMRRPEIGTARPAAAGGDSFAERTSRAAAYVKSRGATAAAVMSRNLVTAQRDTPLAEIAELMERRRIKRVPVVEDGRLVGIVSRLDLVRTLYTSGLGEPAAPLDDTAIGAALAAEAAREGWRLGPGAKLVAFEGVVHLFGSIGSNLERQALVAAARAVPGVRDVQDHLDIDESRIELV
jgi:CBS domain-containing protein